MSDDSHDRVHYLVELGFGAQRARMVRGEEGLSRPSRFEVRFRVPHPEAYRPEDFVGRNAMIAIVRGDEPVWLDPRRLLVLSVADIAVSVSATGFAEVWALLESRLGRLRLRTDIRVFRERTVPEIVEEVLKLHGITVERRLAREYVRRPYTVQFRESDLDFVHRLLEDEGIHYACADGEAASEEDRSDPNRLSQTIRLGDTTAAYDELPGGERVPFFDPTALERPDEFVYEIEETARVVPSIVTVRDFSADRPSLDLVGTAKVPRSDSGREHYAWGVGFELPEEGARRAADRAEAYAAAAHGVAGAAELTTLAPGRTLRPEGGPSGAYDERLVATVVRHEVVRGEAAGKGDAGGAGAVNRYRLELEGLPADRIYRPLIRTAKPKIDGFLEGFVCGPDGADLHPDAMGRVKVRFPWDRKQRPDDNVSHWVPVLHDNTGQAGAIPRVDWELLCGFVDGDPDRPVAIGRLYNARDPFPTELPAGKTKSALRSLSSPGRDGENAIWIEDAAGRELMSVVAEKDQRIEVENDRTEKVVGDEKTTIIKDETVKIGKDRETRVQDEHNATVSGNQTITVGGSHTLKIGAGLKTEVKKDRSLKIGTMHLRKIGGEDNVAVKGMLNEIVGGAVIEASLKKNERAAGIASSLTVGGAIVELSLAGKSEQTEMLRFENIFGTCVSTAVMLQQRGFDLTRTSSHLALAMSTTLGDVTLEAKGELVPPLTIDIKGSGTLKATELVISSGEHSVTITGEKIDFDSKEKIVFEGVEGGTASLLAKGATIDKA